MSKEFKFKTHPADFEIMYSAIKNFTLEMGVTMERTSRSPIYFAAHDFSTALFDRSGKLVSLSEYIPIHLCAASFAIRAALQILGDKIYSGDVILTNDPYTLDAGNHLADWTIMVPVFYQKKFLFWSVNRAHQMDTGGGIPGGYNPNASDILAEGMRIPPVKIYERGKPRRDILDLLLANVRFPESQRGDLQSMIGSAKVGERRLKGLVGVWGVEKVENFIYDLNAYTEFLMRGEIDRIPDGTYTGETWSDGLPGIGPAVAIRCKTTVKGDHMVIDLSDTDPMICYYINSTVPNTYSAVFMALLTSIGRTIQYRSEGIMKAVEIKTKPGTLAHSSHMYPVGLCTLFVAKQIIEAVWDSLSKVVPEKTPAGWGGFAAIAFSGVDPRKNEGYASPDFLAVTSGAGAIWGTDGWHGNHSPISSGGLSYPEIEICESKYPALWEKWEISTDSGGVGKWRGGGGMESEFVLEADRMQLAHQGDHFRTLPGPAVNNGKKPPHYCRRVIIHANGKEEDASDSFYILKYGEKLASYCQGGCGVGDPLEREIESVRQDALNNYISLKSAKADYGVVIDPKIFTVDEVETSILRESKRQWPL